MDVKYDKILGSMREKDASVVFAGDASDLFSSIPSDSKTFTSNEIVSRLDALIKLYGDTGRIRYDTGTKHFYFEVKQPDSSWATKFEIGGSAYVDVVNFLKTVEPATDSIRKGSTAFYSKEITLPNGDTIDRPEFKTSSGDKFNLVVHHEGTDDVVYRKSDGKLIRIPVVYTDNSGTEFTDISKIKFNGNSVLSRDSNGILSIDLSKGNAKDELMKLSGDDRLPASAIKDLMQEQEVIDLDTDLTIDRGNYLDYRYKTISCTKGGNEIQNILLPEIRTISGAADFTIVNSRGDNKAVIIKAYSKELINNRQYMTLFVYGSVTLERPIKGKRWIIKSRTTSSMDGGEI